MPGISEWIVILVIVLIIFGAGKLPQVGEALGRSIKNFKRASGPADDDAKADDNSAEKKS
ncbi:MAG: twin-arginine translocase TatA/TatE family subunit [Myxococcota bacterium]